MFLVNLPVGALAIVLTARFVPESRAPRARRIDPVGQGLVLVMLASVTYAIIEGHSAGWLSAEIIGLFVLALASLATLIRYERRREEPLLEIRFFASAPFSGASAIAVCGFAAFGGFLFLNTLYLQDARGLSPFHAGLYLLPMAATTIVFAPLSGRLVGSRGARPPLLVGAGIATVSLLMLTRVTPGTSPAYLLLAYVLFGMGFGLLNPPITNTAVSGMPPAQAGVAAAVASTSRQVGVTLGVAIVGAVTAGGLTGTIGRGFASASHPAWWILVGLMVLALALAALTTTRWAYATALATTERFRQEQRPEPIPAPEATAA